MHRFALSAHTILWELTNRSDAIKGMEATHQMGEWTRFEPGDKAPNDGIYIEDGENSFHMGINNPHKIRLRKGERFPDTTNHNRKWKRMR
ncbi:hypothetical protein PACILC2_25900 [Paenibacillus cisolokensis]|jgi:hypothetical protein|uniref:YjzC family protein n=2 Tax=Paenibacillus TaxID=44249 RepID=A0ABQ4N736_9BACL|nr:hypothetical protein PACILC2_25900 [Paenibacillus cisolokensis]